VSTFDRLYDPSTYLPDPVSYLAADPVNICGGLAGAGLIRFPSEAQPTDADRRAEFARLLNEPREEEPKALPSPAQTKPAPAASDLEFNYELEPK
jgi:hypothetical protein